MKKNSFVIIVILCIVYILFAFGACQKNEGTTSNGQPSDNIQSGESHDNPQTQEHTHAFSALWSYDDDYHWHASTCGHSVIRDKSAHNWNGGEITTTASCESDGIKIYTCLICLATMCEKISATGHSYSSDGICSACGADRYENLILELNSDNKSYTLTGVEDNNVLELVIPPEYKGVPITRVAFSALSDCRLLTDLTLPFVGLTKGGTNNTHFGYIFGANSYLDNGKCVPSSLKNVVITHETDIEDSAFYDCNSLNSIELPNSVTHIGFATFSGCNSLESIILPFVGSNANAIEASTSTLFGYIFGTTSYTGGEETQQRYNSYTTSTYYIPNSLKNVIIKGGNILYGAFYNCSNLINIVIPSNVTSIGGYAFNNCKNLLSVKLIDEGLDILSEATSIGERSFYNCVSLTSIDIPSGVTSIGNFAFDNCSSLSSIEIPNGVESIGNWAFYNCSGFTSLIIPSSLNSIGEKAFSACDGLEIIMINSNNVKYKSEGNCIIEKDTNALIVGCKTSIIPDYVTSIGDSAFYDCSSLTSIEIPNSVTSIDRYAFQSCRNLVSVEMSSNITSVGASAFFGCNSLKYNEYDNGRYLGNNDNPYLVFYSLKPRYSEDPKITSCIISIKTKVIAYGAFTGGDLTSIEIPSSVTHIGDYAFYQQTNLTKIVMQSGVLSIGASAFIRCSNLTSVAIPNSVKTIGQHAFDECSALTTISIPSSVTSIGRWAFANCSSLKSITIPGSVTDIGEYTFYKCSSLTSVVLQSGVRSIGSNAFSQCGNLTSISLPNSLTSIGGGAFLYCSSLTSIVIPSSVTSISNYAFQKCTSLTFYCRASSRPSGWATYWNSDNRPVIWGY